MEHIAKLIDILYYRQLDLSIGDIYKIQNDQKIEDIIQIFGSKRKEIQSKIQELQSLMQNITLFEKMHKDILLFLDQYTIVHDVTIYILTDLLSPGQISEKGSLFDYLGMKQSDLVYITYTFQADIIESQVTNVKEYFATDAFSNEMICTNQLKYQEKLQYQSCVYTVKAFDKNYESVFNEMIAQVKAQGYAVGNKLVANFLVSTNIQGCNTSFYEIYIPFTTCES